jgi:CDP-6-deoxy-D-xylo-4-hexulose-3-dehydrase
MNWKLMSDEAITREQRKMMAEFILTAPKLTYGERVREFESQWARWQNCEYAVFVNSGSSANLLIIDAALNLYGAGGFAAQSCTWATNVAPLLQLKGAEFVQLVGVDLQNLGADLNDLEKAFQKLRPRFLFLTHVLGFPAISDALLGLCRKYEVTLLEDCCESHGATFRGVKVGNFGVASSFSFYYGHHLTTIEGGMVCTNDRRFYERILLLRSHGLLRELPPQAQKQNAVADCDARFTFLCAGYNVRNMEMNALLGTAQLRHLDEHIKIRNQNFQRFIENLDGEKYHTDFRLEGISNYAFPIIAKRCDRQKLCDELDNHGIENRPLIAGSLYRHPLMQNISQENLATNSDYIHERGIYVGNHQFVTIEMVDELCRILNEF